MFSYQWMQSITPQAGSVIGHQIQREKWSILYRHRSALAPSMTNAGARARYPASDSTGDKIMSLGLILVIILIIFLLGGFSGRFGGYGYGYGHGGIGVIGIILIILVVLLLMGRL
jgi:Na+/melibiose symporter-like transporter